MGALLESGLVGNIGLKHLKVIKEDTITKWDKLGFLEGLKGHMRENVAQLYENQASYLINEASSTSDTGAFETVVFPIVRRVFSKLLANDIVSVQAMNLPIGKLFYFVPNIQSYDPAAPAGLNQHYSPYGAPDGPTSPNAGYNYNNGRDLYDRFYEGNEPALDPPGLFDYSKGSFTSVTSAITSVVTAQWNNTTLNLEPAAYATDNYRKVLVIMSGFASDGAGKLIGPDGNPIDTESFLSDLTIYGVSANPTTAGGGPYLFRVVTQRYGKGIVQYGNNNAQLDFPGSLTDGGQYDNICDVAGNIYLEIDLQVPVCITCGGSMDGYTGSTFSSTTADNAAFSATYRLYKNLEFEDKIGEVSFDLMSVTVSVTERKLRAQWSPEMAQDVAAFHNIDAEAELTALLSEQVAAEIDREILRDLRKGAAWNLRWDYNGWKRLGGRLTPTMYNPFNFTPIKGIMTRYAKKMVNNRFYGRITVDGVRTFDLKELR